MIWRIRVLFFYLMACVLTAIHIPPLALMCLLKVSYPTKYILARTYNYSFVYLVKVICALDYKVEGAENIPTKGPVVILSNHQSFWDNVIMPVLFPIQTWIIKKQLLDIPIFGLGLGLMDPIALDRTDPMSVKKMLRVGAKKIQDGISVVIFPESTRLNPGQNVPFKAGCATLAYQNEVPIIPVAHNAGVFWPKGFWIRPGTITIRIGKAMVARPDQDSRALSAEVEKWITETKNSL